MIAPSLEFPPDKRELHRKAVRLEWLTIAYLLSATFFLFLTIGSSQAGKAALVEDLLSLTPPLAFLIAARIRTRSPDERHPWGHHRSVSIAYQASALALLLFGSFIFVDSLLSLVAAKHPPIGVIEMFGQTVWLGWPMLAALVWSGVPAFFLGRAKMPLAQGLHDKVLYADAKMNKADWLTSGAAIVGVIGIGLGFWWADAAAAIAISLDIVHDGYTNLRTSVNDLMDSRPTHYDGSGPHPLVKQLERALEGMGWVDDAQVRLREEGHVFAGEALVVPADADALVDRLDHAAEELRALDWRLHDLVVVPVARLEGRPDAPAPQADGMIGG
jgi:cation diffusion facilitator family transporter